LRDPGNNVLPAIREIALFNWIFIERDQWFLWLSVANGQSFQSTRNQALSRDCSIAPLIARTTLQKADFGLSSANFFLAMEGFDSEKIRSGDRAELDKLFASSCSSNSVFRSVEERDAVMRALIAGVSQGEA
jgi:hypothetical protein